MFICDKCIKKYDNHPTIRTSFGKCEICGRKLGCSDIPSKYIRVKLVKGVGYYHPDTMKWISTK